MATGASFEVKNDELGFKLTLPDGFKPYDKLASQSDPATKSFMAVDYLYSFNKGGNPETNNWLGIFLDIERTADDYYLGFKPEELLSAGETVSEKKWGSCNINIFRNVRIYRIGSDEKLITLNAIIPLKSKPIKFKLSGVEADEAEMSNILDSALKSLDGKSDCAPVKNNNYKILFAVLMIILTIIIIKKLFIVI